MARGGYERWRERLAYNSAMMQNYEEMGNEFVEVSKEMKGHVIGRGGSRLHEIMRKSGASIDSHSRDVGGFTVSGDREQRECAKRLILEKVEETTRRKQEEALPGELVEVPQEYKGLVIGKGGDTLRNISTQTGAEVIRKGGEVYIASGTEEQREQARVHIKIIIAGGRIRGAENEFNTVCCYIDGWNLPEDCELKLEPLVPGDRMVHPGSQSQYRLKPSEDYGSQETCRPSEDPSYMSELVNSALESLRKIKLEMKTKEYLKTDMWCHFGTAIVRGPDQVEADKGKWTINEAAQKFQSSNEGNIWKAAFKEGVNLDEKILEGNACNKTPKEYVDYTARYDLTFLTPCGHQIRFKVWVTKKDAGKTMDDIPIPFSDVKNILDEMHFEDEETRSRCRGWLVTPSRRYLQADILFPGCEFDCRFTIRGRADSALATDYVPKAEAIHVLSRYLSGLTLTDEDGFGLRLPEGNIPAGFHLIHKRCSKRSLYEIIPGFAIILSKENSWRSNVTTEESRVSTDFHLHCREWDELLDSGDWDPEIIVAKLPDFFRFVKKVQGFVSREMKETGLERTIPPEILARGTSALDAYNKALADGKTSLKRVPLMLIGQDRAGKTSLKKSLRGICFDPEEDSTVGIDVDPSHFKVSTETWRTGETGNDQTSDTAISFDYRTARWVVDSLMDKSSRTLVERVTDESGSTFVSEITEMPTPTASSGDAENILTSRDAALTLGRDVTNASPDSSERKQEDGHLYTPHVPEEVASVTETLLQSDREDDREDIYSTLWDFAGQSVYYVTHPLFLTARAIYCLVYDLSLNPHDTAKPLVKQGVYKKFQDSFNLKSNFDYLDFWMMSVASLASSENEPYDLAPKSELLPEKLPPVFLVCTHADTPYGDGDPRELSRQIFGCLKRKPYGAQLFDVFCVDNTSLSVHRSECPEVLRLRKEVLAVAKELPHINEVIPIRWLKFEKALQAAKEKGHKLISLQSAKYIASKVCNIDQYQELETLINYLHDLRSLIHFDDSPELNKLVVLDPQWLIDVFKKVITVKPYDSREKKFLDLWCKLEDGGILDEKLLSHVWGHLFNNRETFESLIGIMQKFSLLCAWPSEDSSNKNYLVPSMLRSHPPTEIIELVKSAKIPSLFIKFENGQVPPGLFVRLVLQFFQWGKEKFWRPVNPQLFHNFARFFTFQDDYSVILLGHSSSVEVVVHKGNLSLELEEDLSSKMTLSADFQYDTAGVTCARDVRRQLGLMLECMRNEFCWLRNMRYDMSVICPVCCPGGAVDYCSTHHVRGCKEEQCFHFLSESELCGTEEPVICTKSASAQNIGIQVMKFAPWFATPRQQLAVVERDGRRLFPGLGNEDKVLALPNEVMKSLSSETCDSTQVVGQLKEILLLDQSSLEQPNRETKKWIRCLARNAKCSNRRDVVEHLREITPAGTTGPLLPEDLDMRRIPPERGRQLTITLSGGEEWKLLAEKLGFNPDQIRYLDKRTLNPADAALCYIAKHYNLTVGDLYDVLCNCGLPVVADGL